MLDEIERHINGEYKLIVKEKEKVIEQAFGQLPQSFLPPTTNIEVITMPKVYQMPKEWEYMANDYYNNVHRVLFDIDSNRTILNNYISERAHLIALQEPPKVKSIDYSQPMVQSSSKRINDLDLFIRIEELNAHIACYQKIITEKEMVLESLKHLGNRMLLRLEARGKEDLRLRIFIMSYIEGKTNEEIKEEIGNYEMQTIWNIKTELNNLAKEAAFNDN